MKKFALLFALATTISSSALAVQEPTPLSTDFRIRVVPYNPNDVYKFIGHYGYASSIEFAENEDVKTISIGDSTAWQVVPSGNRIFLKPIEQNPQTNMTVVTNKHVYLFELHGKLTDDIDDRDMVFVYRFIYPGETDVNVITKNNVTTPEISVHPEKYNQRYTISGADRIAPIRIFDDGEFTYFQFKDVNADIPAFFRVDSRGREAIINYRTVGDYIVVERVTSQFTLRDGEDTVCVFNEAMPQKIIKEEEGWFD